MTTKRAAHPRQKKSYWEFVNDIVKHLKSHFYLHAWSIRVLNMKEAKGEANRDCYSSAEVIASMGSDDSYMDATLKLYPAAEKLFKDKRYDYLGSCLVHEFCHVLTDPLYKVAVEGVSRREGPNLEHVRENTTQSIANIVMPGIDKSIFSPYKVTGKGDK